MRGARVAGVLAALLLAAIVLFASSFRATHEPDHRFYVSGRVIDQAGLPFCGVTVRAADITAPSSDNNVSTVTDFDGRFRVLLHLHSAAAGEPVNNEGDSILITVEGHGVSQIVAATRSPSPDGWGEAVVPIPVPHPRQTDCQNSLLTTAFYVGVPIAAILGGFVAYRRLRFRMPVRREGLEQIPGIGHAKAARLREAGFTSIERLARASPKDIASATGIPAEESKRLVRKAKEYLMREGSGSAAKDEA